MSKYHINDNGDTGLCSATIGDCPFGGIAQHYPDKQTAQKAFELSMAHSTFIEKSRSAIIARELNYKEITANAKASIDVEGISTFEKKMKAFKDFSAKSVPLNSKVMVRMTDGTIIFDETGTGYKDGVKPNFFERKTLGEPNFIRADGAYFKGLDSGVSLGTIRSISVLEEFPELPEKTSVGEVKRNADRGYTVFSPSFKDALLIVRD